MSHKLLRDARVYGVLLQIDRDLAASTRSGGCACGGRLHSARYRRKPRCGLELEKLEEDHGIRFSFCCDREGCRRRSTPPSVRFLGRRVYVGAVVVLIAALSEGATPARLRRLARLVGDVSRRTIQRRQRQSDGTVSLLGQRFELPSRLRTLEHVCVRVARWDLGFVTSSTNVRAQSCARSSRSTRPATPRGSGAEST